MENETRSSRIRSEFSSLPLDQKFAELFRMEAKTIEEAITYVVEQPWKALEKVGDAISCFGERIEEKARCAYQKTAESGAAGPEEAKKQSRTRKDSAAGDKSDPGTSNPS